MAAASKQVRLLEYNDQFVLKGTWCSGITPAQHAGGPGFNPQRVHHLWILTVKWYDYVRAEPRYATRSEVEKCFHITKGLLNLKLRLA